MELDRLGFYMGLTGQILKEDLTLYALKMQPVAALAVSIPNA
jgi:hypothetical protein